MQKHQEDKEKSYGLHAEDKGQEPIYEPEPDSRGGKEHWKFLGVVGVLILVGVLVFAGKGLIDNRPATVPVDSTLALEKEAYGLNRAASRDDLWQAMRDNPILELRLYKSGTTLFIHSLVDVVSVNGFVVDPINAKPAAVAGYIGQPGLTLTLPAGTTAVTFHGVRASRANGKIIFIMDTLPALGNGGNLPETHQGVALVEGETVTVPVVTVN